MSHEDFMNRNALYGAKLEKKPEIVSEFIDHLKDEKKCPPICSTERIEVEEFVPVDGKLKIRTETPEYEYSSGLKVGIVGCGRGLVRGEIMNSLEKWKVDTRRPIDYPLNEDGSPQQIISYEVAHMQETKEGFGIITRNKRFYPTETLQKGAHQMFLTNSERCGDRSVVGELLLLKESELFRIPKKQGVINPFRTADIPESRIDSILEKVNRGTDIRSAYIPSGRYYEHELYVGEGRSAFLGDKLTARYGNKCVSIGPDHEKPKFKDGCGGYPLFPERLSNIQRYCFENVNIVYESYWQDLIHIEDIKPSNNILLMIATYQYRTGYKYLSVSRCSYTIEKVKIITEKKRDRRRFTLIKQ